jgi:hypothetical protein
MIKYLIIYEKVSEKSKCKKVSEKKDCGILI